MALTRPKRWAAYAACLWSVGCTPEDTPPIDFTNSTGTDGVATTSTTSTPPTGTTGGAATTGTTNSSGTTSSTTTTAGSDSTTSTGNAGNATGSSGELDAGRSGDGGGTLEDSGASPMEGGTSAPAGTVPIEPPVATGCVTDVSAGDHTFTCQGVEFMVMVDPRCTEFACGLIFDVHGALMTGEDMRQNNRLHELAPPQGYLTVHPTAPGSGWDWDTGAAAIDQFMQDMIQAFHADPRRVHMTGFSMGSGMTFWFLCNRTEVLASTAPITGSSASQVTNLATGQPCIESINESWSPRVPILFMSGTADGALSIEDAQARTDGIVSRLGLTGGDEIDGDGTYRRRRWTDGTGMVFDFLTHDYESLVLAGHCIPGNSSSGNLFSCGSEGDRLDWGATVLEWFIEHPKP